MDLVMDRGSLATIWKNGGEFSSRELLRWCRGSVLASDTKVRGFKPGQSRWIGDKNPQHAFLRKGSKIIGPMSQICGM